MHPLLMQQLAADRISHMVAQAEDRRLARRARLARRSPASGQQPEAGGRRLQAEPERPSPTTAAPGVPIITTPRSRCPAG